MSGKLIDICGTNLCVEESVQKENQPYINYMEDQENVVLILPITKKIDYNSIFKEYPLTKAGFVGG